MKNKIFGAFLFLTFFSLGLVKVSAQAEIKPYTLGEVLTYEGKFSKSIIRGIAVADLSFTVENAPNSENYLIKSEAKSKGTLAKLLRFTFLQQMESTVDVDKLNILKSKRHDEQNERVRDSEAVFDYLNKQVTFTETNPKDAMRAPRKVASQIESNNTQDFITGLYSLRRMALEVGKTFDLVISDSGLIYKVPVRVTARVKQKSVLGNLWCFRLEPEIFGEDRLIEQKGSLIIWITDDTRRIPVRGQINASIGRVEVKLKTVSYKAKEK
ncbi:MAG TPA: DUF3108 domain-containing protein [Pyrinomonadaceae bacterium]|jgi:hypothetical protein